MAARIIRPADPNLIDLLAAGQVDTIYRDMLPDPALYHTAKRFVLDRTASGFVGELTRRATPEVLSQHEWARAPFPTTWIEMDHRAYWNGMTAGLVPSKITDDKLFGMLVHNDRVWFYSNNETDAKPAIGPYTFRMHLPMAMEQELELAQLVHLSRLTFRLYMLGGMIRGDDAQAHRDWLSSREAAAVCRAHTVEFSHSMRAALRSMPGKTVQEVMHGSSGTLKIVLTLLLLLSRPHKSLVVSEVGHRRMLIRGKPVVHKAHSRIGLRLEHEDPVTRFISGLKPSGIHRQRHDVRGHWAQSRKMGAGCTHQWEPDLDADHFQCALCGAKRWWRKNHQRGSSQVGSNTAEYEVKR
jgi:hypothetical protein